MKHENVTIRTKEQLNNKDGNIFSKKLIKTALECAMLDKSKKFPLVYRYLEDRPNVETEYREDKLNIIGTVSNIHHGEDGSVVADVVINDAKSLAFNFTGSIDNVTVKYSSVNRNKRAYPEIVDFVVYDRFAKEAIDKNVKKTTMIQKSDSSPVEYGDVQVNDDNPLFIPGVMDAIHDDMRKEIK